MSGVLVGAPEQLVDQDLSDMHSSIAQNQTFLEAEFALVTSVLQQHSSFAKNQTSPEAKLLYTYVLERQESIKVIFDSVLAESNTAKLLSSCNPPNQPPDDPMVPSTSSPMAVSTRSTISTESSSDISLHPPTSPESSRDGDMSPQHTALSSSMAVSTKSTISTDSSSSDISQHLPLTSPESSSDSDLSPQPQLSLEQKKFNMVRSIGEECIEEKELRELLAKKSEIICYDGFEPSGRMHIAQGVMKALNVNKLIAAGCKVKFWIADWFAMTNGKMGGDLKKIQVIGEYLIEIWKALNMNVDEGKVEFLWASKEINSRANEYWLLVMDIARRNTLSRITRCGQIMGRSEKEELLAAQILYPCMQCADVFFLKADICQMGMDQRKVNVLAREYCNIPGNLSGRNNKPIILSHHMLPGLLEGQEKMSKSDPSSSIFMEDEEGEVNSKIKKAFCPPRVVEKNPCLDYIKYIIFPWFSKFAVERKPENGGDKTFTSFEDLVIDYESGELHPGDLKPALAKALNCILQPVRDHFNGDPKAKQLLKRVKSYKVTRQ